MNAETTTDEQFDEISRKKAHWAEIIQQWDELTPLAPVPTFTRAHAEKMIKKLEAQEKASMHKRL